MPEGGEGDALNPKQSSEGINIMRSLRHITQREFSFCLIFTPKFKTEIYDMFSVLRAFVGAGRGLGMPIMQTSYWRFQDILLMWKFCPLQNPRACCGQCDELFINMWKVC